MIHGLIIYINYSTINGRRGCTDRAISEECKLRNQENEEVGDGGEKLVPLLSRDSIELLVLES